MDAKGTLSKSGVIVFDSYKDNIIIDKYNRVFLKMRSAKLEAIRSENSEDALTWNVFRTLQKIDPELWLPTIFVQTFQDFRQDLIPNMKISLWKRLQKPESYKLPEGDSEIDIMLENDHYVWFIEAKYKSDISMNTRHDETRNQILHCMDVGSDYAKSKDFYFSLLILDEKCSPKGKQLLEMYKKHPIQKNLKGISLLKWEDFKDIFRFCEENAQFEDERLLARLAGNYLENRINH